ncbi:MAG: hypothetical protein V4724_31255 [Pseudomonadota bacterium]
MLAASGALTGCGGGDATSSNPGLKTLFTPVEYIEDAAVSLPPANNVAGVTIASARFTLKSLKAQAAAPYCLGYAFRRGDVPAGNTVAADQGTMQVSVKNTWPDGSLKFAVLAGQADLQANAPLTVNLRVIAMPAPSSVLDTARLRATGAVAQIDCGTFGAVTWQGSDWDAPLRSWVSGSSMSSWIYRKPVGSDAHLVAWLEVRLWSSGAVEVLPWIENGYLKVAAPSNRSATYSFTLGGTRRMSAAIDLKHHQRTPLVSGTALSYWLANDPGVIPKHDTAYLQSTELVPSYRAQVDASAVVVQGLAATYQPLQAGNFNYDSDSMASSGYQDPIGLLPQHDVLYLVSSADSAYGAVVRNGFSAGRYGIHYRDETTQRPLRFSSYPTLNIRDSQGFKDTGGSTTGSYTPVAGGGNPPNWDVAHSPSLGYLAYLVTGRWYFMEEVQFVTTANYLGNGDNTALRTGSKGLVQTAVDAWQTRSCAWDWRARVQALCVTPDDDSALRSEFIASVEANIEHFHGRYVARANNPYGWIKPGEAYDGTIQTGSPWQQDFVTAAFGYSLSLGLPISSAAATKLDAFFQWKARSAISRLGPKGAFWYVNAVPYTLLISPSPAPDYDTGAGPWLTSEAAVYNATYAVVQPWMGKVDGILAAEYLPGERALWGNLQPAIAYAVRHGVPGAQQAYDRMVGASNWSQLRDAFNAHPVWAVQPLQSATAQVPVTPPPPVVAGTLPLWLAGKPINDWIEIPGTSGAGGSGVGAYSGFAFNEKTNEILIAAAGGHWDSSDNRVVSLSLNDNAPSWQVRMAPSAQVAPDVAYYPDGKPSARHTYSTTQFIPQVNRLMLFGLRFSYGNAYTFGKVDAFNLETNTWDPPGTWADAPPGHYGAVAVRGSGEVWTQALARWSPVSKTWTQPITQRTNDLVRWPIAHDSSRNQLFALNWADGESSGTAAVFASRIPVGGSAQITVTFNPSTALDRFKTEQPSYAAMDYDPDNDRFLFYSGQGSAAGRVYVIKPNAGNTWDISTLALVSYTRPPATPPAGVHNRFRYVPALRGFVMMPSAGSNLYFLRTA